MLLCYHWFFIFQNEKQFLKMIISCVEFRSFSFSPPTFWWKPILAHFPSSTFSGAAWIQDSRLQSVFMVLHFWERGFQCIIEIQSDNINGKKKTEHRIKDQCEGQKDIKASECFLPHRDLYYWGRYWSSGIISSVLDIEIYIFEAFSIEY